MNWSHLMKPVKRKATFAYWGIRREEPIVKVVRASQRRCERRDAAFMVEAVSDRSRRDSAILGERILTRSQQWRRAFHRLNAVEIAEEIA